MEWFDYHRHTETEDFLKQVYNVICVAQVSSH